MKNQNTDDTSDISTAEQFFAPTPPSLAKKAVEMAAIQPHHRCLEPSAGTGAIADTIDPRRDGTYDRVWCVEVSDLNCQVLSGKGYARVTCADFLEWSEGWGGESFDRILMNPPFSQGRWKAHLERAATLLAQDGILVAILPASARGKDLLPGFIHEWSEIYENQFAGASVSVAILKATRP